jgi:hypothetical protein
MCATQLTFSYVGQVLRQSWCCPAHQTPLESCVMGVDAVEGQLADVVIKPCGSLHLHNSRYGPISCCQTRHSLHVMHVGYS